MKKKIAKTDDGVVIAQSVYDNTHKDFKGVWDAERYDWDNWEQVRDKYMGKRTWMPPYSLFNGTCLLVEGMGLEIIPDDEFDKMYQRINN